MSMVGWYRPNEPGARTLREARPLHVGHDLVTAQVYQLAASDACNIAIFIGVELVLEEPVPLEVTERFQVNPYIQDWIAEYVKKNKIC